MERQINRRTERFPQIQPPAGSAFTRERRQRVDAIQDTRNDLLVGFRRKASAQQRASTTDISGRIGRARKRAKILIIRKGERGSDLVSRSSQIHIRRPETGRTPQRIGSRAGGHRDDVVNVEARRITWLRIQIGWAVSRRK
jgi:hypothetical protein